MWLNQKVFFCLAQAEITVLLGQLKESRVLEHLEQHNVLLKYTVMEKIKRPVSLILLCVRMCLSEINILQIYNMNILTK